jgi:tripartite-type tricarboxylate transporter receptor subunit TctC
MLRGVFTWPDVKRDAVDYYVNLFKKVDATPTGKTSPRRRRSSRPSVTGDKFKQSVADAAKPYGESRLHGQKTGATAT